MLSKQRDFFQMSLPLTNVLIGYVLLHLYFCKTCERTLRRSRRVKKWHWTRRCYCAAILPRECHKPRWDTDTEDIFRLTSRIPLPFPHQRVEEQKVAQAQVNGISPYSTRGQTTHYTSNYSPLLIYYLSYIFEKPYITSSCRIIQHRLRGFTPRLAFLKAYP